MTARSPNLIPVTLESPLAGNVQMNLAYARRCVRDCLTLGEAAFGSHIYFAQEGILDDLVLEERELGIEAGFVLGDLTDKTVVYTDLGISGAMARGIARAESRGRSVEYRTLPDWLATSALQFPVEAKFAAKCAEVNTLAIELALAKKRHETLSNMWGVLDYAQRLELFRAIFEGAPG